MSADEKAGYYFLKGGGEMGALTRKYDWSKTTIGTPGTWPQSLRTTISIVLNSKFPMLLWWGDDLIQFYNDAYRPSLGNNGKHPTALGQRGEDCWPEIWPVIKPLIDQVRTTGEATWSEDQLIPIYRNGQLEDVYWTFSYSPVADENANVAGILVTCSETTEKVLNIDRLEDNKAQLEFAIDAAELGTWDLNPFTNKFTANPRLKEWFGLLPEDEIELGLAIEVIAEKDRQAVARTIENALVYESGGKYDIEYTIINPKTQQERIVKARGRAWFGAEKTAYRFNGTLQDITIEKKAQEESASAYRLADMAINSSGIGIFNIHLPNGIIEYSPSFAAIVTGDPEKKGITRADFIKRIHPDDQALREAASSLMQENGEFNYQPRVIWDDGSIHYIRIVGSAIYDEHKVPVLFSGTVQDITAREEHEQKLKQVEEHFIKTNRELDTMFRNVTNSAPTGLWLSDKDGGLIYLNTILVEWTGMKYDELLGTGWANAIVQEDKQHAIEAFQAAIAKRAHYDVQFRLNKADGTIAWYRAAGDPYYAEDGSYNGYAGFCMDIDELVNVQNKIDKNQRQLLASFEESPVGIAIISEDDLTFRTANTFYGQLVGRKPEEIIDKPLLEALPELKGQGFDDLLREVIRTGVGYNANEVPVDLLRNEQMETIYVDLTYQPRRAEDNRIEGVLVVATDVTQQVITRKRVEDSETKLKGIIASAPAGIGLFVGRDLVIENPNQTFIDIVGKGPDIEGLTLREAMPELITEGQPFLQILDDVFTTGVMFQSFGAQVKIVQNGVMTDNYYNITYTPIFNAEGNVYAILDIAIDVTEQIKAQQKLQETEISLRGAIELAGLATWSLDIKNEQFNYSPRFKEWLGFTEDTRKLDEAYNPLPAEYQASVQEAIALAIAPGSSGYYDYEHPIINRATGEERIIHAQGQVFYDIDGTPLTLIGTAQDITIHRHLQLALEHQVQERTEELASAIEELQATNEELAVTNEELEESNSQLTRSNDELAQYAYVASHDLQEPLRKIRVFSGMLNSLKNISVESRPIIDKISHSAERMSLLIQDLLQFSRLLNSETLMSPIDLNDVVRLILSDFELTISEKNAQIAVGELPVIEAVNLQMSQLFFNLMSNSLKFISPDKTPEISITARKMAGNEVKKYISTVLPGVTYYDIAFSDNGIGFDTQYYDQIFEVFKRLHSREEYPGSGIGLSLCRRIVMNHNGMLYATSEADSGSTFHIILPSVQYKDHTGVILNK